MKKNIIYLSFVLLLLLFSSCSKNNIEKNNVMNNNQEMNKNEFVNSKNINNSKDVNNQEIINTEEENNIENNNNDDVNVLKKQIIIWWSTTCPHCVNAMPEFKEKIYDVYNDNVDIIVNSVNWEKFNVDIPQNLNLNNMKYFDTVVWKECNYVPSFAVLDENSNVILSSCWWEKTIDDILNVIK